MTDHTSHNAPAHHGAAAAADVREQSTAEPGSTIVKATEPPFDREQVAEFDEEDRQAGGAIGKMLALFFLYTVLVMTFVAWWTYRSVTPEQETPAPAKAAAH